MWFGCLSSLKAPAQLRAIWMAGMLIYASSSKVLLADILPVETRTCAETVKQVVEVKKNRPPRAGIVLLPQDFWTDQHFVEIFKRIHEELGPEALKSSSMQKELNPDRDKIIQEVTGSPHANSSRFFQAANKKFKDKKGERGWARALEAHGIDVSEVNTRSFNAWSKDKIKEAILIIQEVEGFTGLSYSSMRDETSPLLKQKLKEKIGPITKQAVLEAARKNFTDKTELSSWDQALVYSGIDPVKVRERGNLLPKEVVDRSIQALLAYNRVVGKEERISLRRNDFVTDKSEATLQILAEASGVPNLTPSKLVRYAREYYDDSWNAALISQSVNDKRQIIRLIQRSVLQIPIEDVPYVADVRVVEGIVTGSKLYNSLDEATEAAKIDAEVEKVHWTKDLIRRGLRAIYDAGHLPSSGFLQNASGDLRLEREGMNILYQALGVKTRMFNLYQAALYHYDSFESALIDAGLDPQEIRQRLPKYSWKENPDAFRLVVAALIENGIPPTTTVLSTSDRHLIDVQTDIIDSVLGQRVRPASFLMAVQVYQDSDLKRLIYEAGYDPEEVQNISVYPWHLHREKIIEALRALHTAGYVPSPELLTTSNAEIRAEMSSIIERIIGVKVMPTSLYLAAISHLQNRLPSDPDTYRLKVRHVRNHSGVRLQFDWLGNREKFLATLRALNENGFPPIWTTLNTKDEDSRKQQADIIEKHLGARFLPSTIYSAIYEEYETTPVQILYEAGINPWEIYNRVPRYIRGNSIETQWESGEDVLTGDFRSQRLVGRQREAAPTAEPQLHMAQMIHIAERHLDDNEMTLFAEIIFVMTSSSHNSGPTEIAAALSQRLGSPILEEDVLRLFHKLSQIPEFVELMNASTAR